MPALRGGSVPAGTSATRTLLPSAVLGQFRSATRPSAPGTRRPLPIPVLAGGAAIVLTVVVFLLLHGHSSPPANGTSANAKSTASAPSQAAQRQAAVALSALLAQSVADRGAVIDAVVGVRGCGSSLPQDARTFVRAAESRRHMVSRVRSLAGASALPSTMLKDLTGAWEASAQADSDLARWAEEEIVHGCNRDSAGSSQYLRASYVPDGQATTDKQAFASLWDPIARRFNLTPYQWDQL